MWKENWKNTRRKTCKDTENSRGHRERTHIKANHYNGLEEKITLRKNRCSNKKMQVYLGKYSNKEHPQVYRRAKGMESTRT